MKKCNLCKIEKDFSEFNKNKKKKDGLDNRCKICTRKRDKVRYDKDIEKFRAQAIIRNNKKRDVNREHIYKYLNTHPCVDCNESDPIVLEFDHVRGMKKWNIGDMVAHTTIETLDNEIAKCDVRCANCHRRKTAKQFNWYKKLKES